MLADALAGMGDRDGAIRELKRAHDVFARLGAVRELSSTRDKLRELNARLPPRVTTEGSGVLTKQEMAVALLVYERKSNKEIGRTLGISARTVSTHLSNIYGKLEIDSRGELADIVRERGWAREAMARA
jgi:DNA-binding CsgD family transcriptional regulator